MLDGPTAGATCSNLWVVGNPTLPKVPQTSTYESFDVVQHEIIRSNYIDTQSVNPSTRLERSLLVVLSSERFSWTDIDIMYHQMV